LSAAPGVALAQDDDPAFRPKPVRVAKPDTSGVYLYGGSGVAVFQDIQVPVNEFSETRGDGSAIAEENQDHLGLPLFAGIGYRKQSGAVLYDFAGLEGTKIRATTGPSATQSSSYTRLELFSGATYGFRLGYTQSSLGLRAGFRRSMFANISNAHFIESALVRLQGGLERGSFGLKGFVGYAPLSRVGYTREGITGGDYFSKAKTTVAEAGLAATFALQPNSFLDLGIEQEAISMRINDIMEYNGFGLNVTPGRQTSREYNLSTVMAKAGFRKLF
jgi:hypothetical protein